MGEGGSGGRGRGAQREIGGEVEGRGGGLLGQRWEVSGGAVKRDSAPLALSFPLVSLSPSSSLYLSLCLDRPAELHRGAIRTGNNWAFISPDKHRGSGGKCEVVVSKLN